MVRVGGETSLPFLGFEGKTPHRPVIAMEVLDVPPPEWPKPMAEAVADVSGDPVAGARKCVEQFGADLIALRLVM